MDLAELISNHNETVATELYIKLHFVDQKRPAFLALQEPAIGESNAPLVPDEAAACAASSPSCADRREVLYVSVLLATGLIEAEITTLKAIARYAASQVATVIRITEDGLAEIAKMGDVPQFVKTSMRFARGLRLM